MSFIDIVRQSALCNPPTLDNTVNMCEEVIASGVQGDFVECGVFAGAQTALMADAIMRLEPGSQRKVHLYDSFQGIPEAGPCDDETITGCIGPSKEGRLISSGVSVCSQESVRKNMQRWGIDPDLLVYHEGWFQDTLPTSDIKKIAVLRLDGDLYESTVICLRHLHPLVQKGGVVIIDDYALTGCRKAVDLYHKAFNLKHEIITIKGGGGPVYYRT